jgi:hypothetical protein
MPFMRFGMAMDVHRWRLWATVTDKADHLLHLDRLSPERFLQAMIRSFHGDDASLVHELRLLID